MGGFEFNKNSTTMQKVELFNITIVYDWKRKALKNKDFFEVRKH